MQPGWYPWPNAHGMKGYWDGASWVAGPVPMEPHEMTQASQQQAQPQSQYGQGQYGQGQYGQGQYGQGQQSQGQRQKAHPFPPVNHQNAQGAPGVKQVSMNEMMNAASPTPEKPKKNKTLYYMGIAFLTLVILFFGWKFYERSQLPEPTEVVTEEIVEDTPQSEEKQSGFEELPPLEGETRWSAWAVPANEEGTQVALSKEEGVSFELQLLGTVGENSFFQTKVTNTSDKAVELKGEEIISTITREGVEADQAIAWSAVEPAEMAEFGLLPESFPSGTQTVEPGESFIVPAAVNAKMEDVISIHIKALGVDYVDYVWLTS